MVSSRRGEGLIFPKARSGGLPPRLGQPFASSDAPRRACTAPCSPHARACHFSPSRRGCAGADAAARAAQGGWETDETAAEAAARESLEEAGVRGELQARLPRRSSAVGAPGARAAGLPPILLLLHRVSLTLLAARAGPLAAQELGSFRFTSKTHRCVAHVFVMRVTEARLCRSTARRVSRSRLTASLTQELAVWPERHERQREWVRARAHAAGMRRRC